MQFIKKVKSYRNIHPKLIFSFGALFTFLFLLSTLSCSRLPNVQGKGETFLQGVWNQDSIPNKEQLKSYTQHHFKFSCDSFYVDYITRSKVNYYNNECFNNGVWKEYAKGTYQVRNDTLILVGDFTKENYKQKVSGCYRNGHFISNFKVKSWSAEQLQLENLSDQTEVILNLKEKITCVQKAL
ncbi:MAG: fumarate hydratase [Pedobacter sp.]|uniref:fumarate hydratase n=1 Tax=Pedobacter sp. TaxID=1411316 RepID=UPI0028072F5F|nr:fumarate hydratase [Pedobacter sp.]MDQ8006527.1 fumarate hydratase [Pedobacter sp.]